MRSLITIFLFLSPILVPAQNNSFVNYSQEEGLTAAVTYRVAQDTKGYIWVGSDNGLFRFDGKHFRQYSLKDGLSNIEVLRPIPLSDGSIFISPFQNDFAWLKNDRIYTARNNSEIAKLQVPNPYYLLRALTNDSGSRVCLYEMGPISRLFTFENGRVNEIPVCQGGKGFPPPPFLLVNYDFKDSLLGVSGTELYKINIRNCGVRKMGARFNLPPRDVINIGNGLVASVRDQQVDLVDINSNNTQVIRFPSPVYNLVYNNNLLWVPFEDGGVECIRTDLSPAVRNGFRFAKDYIINDVLADRDGNIWFSTRYNGLLFMSREVFRNYINSGIDNNFSYITAIDGSKHDIFLGYNSAGGSIYREGKLHALPFNTTVGMEVRSLVVKGSKVLYGFSNRLFVYDTQTGKLVQPRKEMLYIKNMVPDSGQRVLICATSALFSYDPDKDLLQPLLFDKVYCALPYSHDSLFSGGFRDLYKFDRVSGTRTLFSEGLYCCDLKALSGDLFVGATYGNGIVLFNRQKILASLTEKDGLASDKVKHIFVENPTTFWASTSAGLCRISIKGKDTTIRTFTRMDGLPSDNVSGCFMRNDTVFAGTIKGLAILPLQSLLRQQGFVDKEVLLNSVRIGGQEYTGDFENLASTYPDNNVIFDLSFPDYPSLGKVSFRYQVEGLNEEWQTSSDSRIILNALPPGKYTLKVFGINYNGRPSRTHTRIPFTIHPAYWQQWWFRSLLALVILLLIFLLALYIIQKSKAKKMQELEYGQKIAELELQAVKAQINPHFIYNCLNSIRLLLYKQQVPEAENYISTFSKMIRKTLHYSEHTFTTIREETEYLSLYLDMEKLRFKDQFHFNISSGPGVNPDWEIPSLLVQPFVENAIKHGISMLKDGQGLISVDFLYEAPILTVIILDNGRGINDGHTSGRADAFGIRLIRKRIDTFRQLFNTGISMNITDRSEEGERGTRIELHIHIKQ